jgi:hypothetical protein
MAKGERAAKKGLGSFIFGLINPIRDPSLLVAVILTVIEQGGNGSPPTWILVGLLNWVAVKAVLWLLVNFAFSFVFLSRKAAWCLRNPRLAWRLLDALGTEEIIIGGLRPDMFATEDGTMHEGQPSFMPGMVAAQYGYAPVLSEPAYPYGGQGYEDYGNYQGNGYNAYERPPVPSMRLDEQNEEFRELLASYAKLISDWAAFTEEKWRAVSDSQLGWKPLRGRWNGWEEIYQDAFGADGQAGNGQANDPMARRFDNAQTKGSAASAVACFLRDLDSLRQGLQLLEGHEESGAPRMGGIESRPQLSQRSVKAPIIRNPMIVDAD